MLKPSLYSLMSILIKASSEPNIIWANFLAKCVLPIPVGPKNMNTPIGWLGSFKPTRLRWMAFTTLSIALSCAITVFLRVSLIALSRLPSASAMRSTGTPVIIETVSLTSFSVTISISLCSPLVQAAFNSSSSFSKAHTLSL